MEATIWTEALRCQRVAIGDSANPQAVTCERCAAGLKTGNAEADPPEIRGRLPAVGKRVTRPAFKALEWRGARRQGVTMDSSRRSFKI